MSKPVVPVLLKLFLLLPLVSLSISSKGQDIPVSIKIMNTKKEPVAFATIIVTNRLDTTQQVKKSADSSGNARFNLLKSGQ